MLKISDKKEILKAFYAFEEVSVENLKKIYGDPPIFENFRPKTSHDGFFNLQTDFDVLLGICLAKAIQLQPSCPVL